MKVTASSNAIVMEIVKSALASISTEMGSAAARGGYSSLLKEGGDASSAIFDAQGRLLSQGESMSLLHLCSLRPSLSEVMKDFPLEAMQDGDVYLSNDPYRGGIHSNDILLLKPVFHQGKPVFFTGTLVHVADVGGLSAGGLPATATEMYHEGLILPPVKLNDAGVPNQTLLTIIAANSRAPEMVLGDIRALLGGVNVGARRLSDLIAKYGLARLNYILEELIDYAARRTRQEIARLRSGTYEGCFAIDDDGVETRPGGFVVRAKIKIDGSSFEVDFTGTDRQARGAINSSVSQSMSGVMFALRCLIDPTIPMNDGCYYPLKVTLPPGTLVNPRPPAAVNARMATIGAIIDAILEAMSSAYAEKAVAASSNFHVYTPAGQDKKTGQSWVYVDLCKGGGGARANMDGIDFGGGALINGGDGGSGQSSEALEMQYPMMVESMQTWQDSGGAGKWRGGVGMMKRTRMLEDCVLTARITDRSIIPPRGIRGGLPGTGGSWVVNHRMSNEVTLPPKCTNFRLKAGDVLTAFGSGGGGMGHAFERDEMLVLQDVREGKVSVSAARECYGVAIVTIPGDEASATVDYSETRRLRRSMSSAAG